ncbi:MAG: hypothetical protein ACOYVG_14310 [Bacteroidota bacterium]
MKNYFRCLLTSVLIFSLFIVCDASGLDTTIIKRSSTNNEASKFITYINPSNNDWHYDSLKSTSLQVSSKTKNKFPYGTWIEAYQYQNKIYLYYPCDLGYISKIEISKSTLRKYGMEIDDYRVVSNKKVKNYFQLNLVDISGNKELYLFNEIDRKRGMAILEISDGKRGKLKKLMIAASHLNNYPMIVNYCEAKSFEFYFDPIDFDKIVPKNKH